MNQIDTSRIRGMASSPLPDDPHTPVVIRIEIERMRTQLYHMIDAQMSGVNDKLRQAVDQAIKEFSFDGQFYNTVQESVRREVDRQTNELVSEVMKETFQHPPFRAKVAKMVVSKLAKY